MNSIFITGVILLAGTLLAYMSQKVRVPKIVGFILAGIVLGPNVLGIIDRGFLNDSRVVIDIALSFIAFMIGGSLKWSRIKNLGKSIFNISFYQAQSTFLITTAGLYLLLPFFLLNSTSMEDWKFFLILSLFLGAIATATAPAAVLAIIHETEAKGKFTTTFLAVVAVDDSFALFNFIFVVAVSSFILGTENIGAVEALYSGAGEIIFAFLAGAASAGALIVLERIIVTRSAKIIAAFSMMMLAFGLAKHYGFDALLSVMVMGIIYANFSESFDFVYEEMSTHFEGIIFLLFFVLSGAYLDFSTLAMVPIVVLVYTLLRVAGKIAGTYIGAVVSDEDENIRRYMGIALLPQAGVSIGLALSLANMPLFVQMSSLILSIIIAATAVNEIVGPVLTKYALCKSGECKKEHVT